MERLLEIFNGCLGSNTTAAHTKVQPPPPADDDNPPPQAFEYDPRPRPGDHLGDGPTRLTNFRRDVCVSVLGKRWDQTGTTSGTLSILRRNDSPAMTSGSDDHTGTCMSTRPTVGCKEAARAVLGAAARNINNTGGKHYAVLGLAVPRCGCRPSHSDVKARHEALCALLESDKTGSLAVADALQLVKQAFAAITDMEAKSN